MLGPHKHECASAGASTGMHHHSCWSSASAPWCCADLCPFCPQYQGWPYAAVRAHVRFSNVTSTVWRDTLFNATRERMCQGGYLTSIYFSVNQLMRSQGLTVIHNSE